MDRIVEKLDALIRSFIDLDQEFSNAIQITKSCKFLDGIDGHVGNSISMKAKLSWATLHSLLHSRKSASRHHGYLWLGDLLLAEIEEGDESIWSSIKNSQKKISLAGLNDYSAGSEIPLHIWLLCGLLKSKSNYVRWGFLYVLERLLVRCKFLLNEREVNHAITGETLRRPNDKSRLEKANAVIDIMSSALSLMAQNETDRLNILKVILPFSDLFIFILNFETI